MPNVIAQESITKAKVEDAIKDVVEGSKVEFGILEIVANNNIGVYPASITPNAYIHGDQLWVRKNGLQIGANREEIITNAYYSGNRHKIQKINIDNEWWVRFEIDINVLNSLAMTFTGQDIKDQFSSVLFDGLKNTLAAKFDAEMIDLYNQGADEDTTKDDPEVAGVVHVAINDILKSNDPINTIINTLNKVNYSLSVKESQITAYRLGSNDSSYSAITQPYLTNLLDNYILRFGTSDATTINEVKNASSLRQLFGISWRKHPFFNQVVNQAATNFNQVGDETIFDLNTTYDFTGLAGLITHAEAGLLPLKFSALSVLPNSTTGNYIVVARVGWGKGLVRPGLYIKIKDSKTDQATYANETDLLAKYLANPTNATITANGDPIATALETAVKAFTPTGTVADFANATVSTTNPVNASTVANPTRYVATIDIPVVSGKVADAKTITFAAYYKNA